MRQIRRRLRRSYADLRSYMAETHDTQANIARHVRTSQPAISRFVRGLTVPKADLAARLVAYARIPLASFKRRRRSKVAE